MDIRRVFGGVTVMVAMAIGVVGCVVPGPPAPKTKPAPEPTPSPPTAGSGDFLETFDTAAGLNRFKTQVMHGFEPPEIASWHGDHNAMCEGPTTTRTVRAAVRAESFYWCAPNGPATGHIMTSMNTTGYAQVNLSPNQVFTKVKRVCWDQNLTDLGGRKWTQMVVVPESIYQANGQRLDYIKPPIQNDVGVGGVRITGETFMLEVLKGSSQTYVGQTLYDADFAGFSTADKAQRFRHCVTDLENGTVRIEMQRPTGTDTRTMQGSFTNGPARVILQDDTYNAPKDEPATPDPFTWHWDNILVDV